MKGYLCELFSSIQGEGLWAGYLHHFLRLAGCSVGCLYCDTDHAKEKVAWFQVEDKEKGRNPVTPTQTVELLAKLDLQTPFAQALAITGGEPLEQVVFLGSLLPAIKESALQSRPILLETSGLFPV